MTCATFLLRLIVACLVLVASAERVWASTLPAHARGGSVYRDEEAAARAHYQRVWAARQTPRRRASPLGLSVMDRASPPAAAGPNTTVNLLSQFVDHQDPSRGTFAQRWWVDTSAVRPCGQRGDAEPCRQRAMLFIHGEGPASSSPTGYAMEYGASTGSYLFALEHRFYGESLPGPLTNRRALETLTVDNVLADLQYFKQEMVRRFFHNDSDSVVWYVVGGSYSGALSVWLRQAYPNDFAAAWSSSGVVNAIFDFTAFDAHVRKVLSAECAAVVHDVLAGVAAVYEADSEAVSASRAAVDAAVGRPEYFSDVDVQWMLTDGAAMAVQYGRKDHLCERLLGSGEDTGGSADVFMARLTALVEVVRQLWGPRFTESCYYSGACLRNASYAALWPSGNYAWVYQCCTELAYWQTSYPFSLRPAGISTTYFMAQCREAFGRDTFPNTFDFNSRHGGAVPHTDHVVATHGSDDPWLPAGVVRSLGADYPVLTAHCAGCGHCADLRAPSRDGLEPPARAAQRRQIATFLNQWLNITSP